jgi:alanyl-tRNA synthetase
VELCGGTHVDRTGEIGLVAITGESGVAAGVRRLEALTGEAARRHLRQESVALDEMAGLLKAPIADLPARVAALLDERRKLERELAEARRKIAMGGGAASGEAPKSVAGVSFLGRVLRGVPAKDLKPLVDEAKASIGSGIVAFVAVDENDRASIVVGVTPDQAGRSNAVDLVRAGAAALGGKGGGGRPDMAQAGGPDGSRAEAALVAVEAAIAGGRAPAAA